MDQTGQPVNWRLPLFHAFRAVAEGRLDEQPPALSMNADLDRSVVTEAVIAAPARAPNRRGSGR